MGIDRRHLRVTGQHEVIADPHVAVTGDKQHDDVTVVVSQAFGPKGDSLVGIGGEEFDGHPAITILVKGGGEEGLLHLSPIHGDDRKVGFSAPDGTKCELFCPVSKQPLDHVPDVPGDEASYYAIYLTPECSEGAMVAISDVWGHYHSRIVDNFELISSWIADGDEVD